MANSSSSGSAFPGGGIVDVGLGGGKSFGVTVGVGGAAEVVGARGRGGIDGAGVGAGNKLVGGADLVRDGLGAVGVIGFKEAAATLFGGGGAAVVLATASPV